MNHRHEAGLAERLREIREDLYGEFGTKLFAEALEIPLQTWLSFEIGGSGALPQSFCNCSWLRTSTPTGF